MKFSTTSANSNNTNKLYEFIFSVYSIAALLSDVQQRIEKMIIPMKIPEYRKENLEKELDLQSFINHSKDNIFHTHAQTSKNQVKSFVEDINPELNFNKVVRLDLNENKEKIITLLDTENYLNTLGNKCTKKLLQQSNSESVLLNTSVIIINNTILENNNTKN